MKQLKTLKSILVGVILLSLSPLATRADVVVNETNFPDPVFRSLIMSYSYLDNNPVILTNAEISKINSLVYEHANYSPSNQNIKSLKGIEYLASLLELRCMNNDISSADLSKNSELMFLDLSGNKLTNIDLSKNTKLKALCLSDNQLTSLDLTKNTWLENVQIQVNQLRAVRFSNGAFNLVDIQCFHNQLNYAAMQRMILSLPVDLNGSKTRKIFAHSSITDTGTEGNSGINGSLALAIGWKMFCYYPDGSEFPYYTISEDPDPVTFNTTNFPDANFRNYISSLGCVQNGKISAASAASVTEMDCSGKGIKSLKGIEYFTGLEFLNCSNNDITELDVSKNVFLLRLYVQRNRIFGTAMSKLINTLPKLMHKVNYETAADNYAGSGYGNLFCCYIEQSAPWEGNTLSLSQAQTCYGTKGWTPLIHFNGTSFNYYMYDTGYSMLQESPLHINAKTFPDANFRSFLTSQSYGSDGYMSESEINNLTSLEVTKSSITNFAGLEYFRPLKTLKLNGQTNLTALDVSKNVNLEKLECRYNKLASLSLTNNTKLKELYVNDTQLSSLDLYPVRNTLETLVCGSSKLTSLNLTSLSMLTGLNCQNNGMTSLNVTQNTALKTLYCGSNKLESLNLANNTQLTGLYCYSNKLTSLNLSKNTALKNLYCSSNQLTSLNLASNRYIENLDCSYNKLTTMSLPSIDLTINPTALSNMYVQGNQLSESFLSNLTSVIKACPTDRKLYVYDNTLGREGNAFSYTWKASLVGLGTTAYHYEYGQSYMYDYANALYSNESFNWSAGSQVTMPIVLQTSKDNLYGFTFDLVLPDGITLTKAEGINFLSRRNVNYTKDTTYPGVYHITVAPSNLITESGNAMKLTLNVTKTLEDHIRLQNIIFKLDADGAFDNHIVGPLTSKVTVTNSNVLGDVNGDRSITPADAIMILYHYFGVEQTGFNIDAADMNKDGNITPADAIEVLYKYFDASGARPTLPASLATEAGEPE